MEKIKNKLLSYINNNIFNLIYIIIKNNFNKYL